MTTCERKSGRRILCIRLSGLGDVVHSLNALSLLREERPDAHVGWLAEDRFAGLLRGHPCVDELIVVPRKLWGAHLKNPLRWRALAPDLYRFARSLRGMAYDVTVDFQSSLKSAWLVLAAGAAQRIGFGRRVNREMNWLAQDELVCAPKQGVHRIERDLALLAPLGIATRYAEAQFPSDERDRDVLDLALSGCLSGSPAVVIHPGTSESAAFKRWPPERFAQVADALVRQRGADVLVSYGPEDKRLAERVVAAMAERGCLAPATADLRQLAHLLSRADLFVGCDSGPLHIASALKVPTVALFGPKDPVQTGPYCSRSVVVTGTAPCRPCTRRSCRDPLCMNTIAAEAVIEAALQVLDGGGQCRAQPGPIRKPFTCAFRSGAWRGRATTCYSGPEFYTRLCEPERLMTREGEGFGLSAEHYRPEGPLKQMAGLFGFSPARLAWRRLLKLRSAGVPAPFPVCWMERGRPWRREQYLITEGSGAAEGN